MRTLAAHLVKKGFKAVGVYLMDALFVTDHAKMLAGNLAALSAMIAMELPHINVRKSAPSARAHPPLHSPPLPHSTHIHRVGPFAGTHKMRSCATRSISLPPSLGAGAGSVAVSAHPAQV
jgi:hypothetical protein